jgi:hypothetical protein
MGGVDLGDTINQLSAIHKALKAAHASGELTDQQYTEKARELLEVLRQYSCVAFHPTEHEQKATAATRSQWVLVASFWRDFTTCSECLALHVPERSRRMNASDVTTELDNKIAALKATAGIMQLRGPDRGGRPRQVAIAGTSNAFRECPLLALSGLEITRRESILRSSLGSIEPEELENANRSDVVGARLPGVPLHFARARGSRVVGARIAKLPSN